MKRTICAIGITFLLALTFAVPALAGGWAVITLDALPGQVKANQPVEIGFMVRQHGVTPMTDQSPVITVNLADSNKPITFSAQAEGDEGHYVAELLLPQAGEWEWSIQVFTMNEQMPPLTVVEAAPLTSEPAKASPKSLPLFTAGFGLLGMVVGLLALQKKVRWAAALVLMGFLISGVGFASAASQPKTRSEAQEAVASSDLSPVDLGRNLFIAKGCMTCHSHNETNSFRGLGIDMGPDLTNITVSPEYLRLWLKDPSAVKSTAQMPTLGLSDAEIEALIMFINNK